MDFIDVTADTSAIDNSMPTLIIGKKRAEEIYGKDKIKVLNKRIEENIYWTYAKNERRNDFEKDVQAFNKIVTNTIFSKIKYEFFNIMMEPYSRIKAFIRFIKSSRKKIIYKANNHLYIYTEGNNNIIGLSLSDAVYCGISENKIMNKIKANINNTIIEDNNFLTPKMKQMLSDSNIYVPYLYFLSQN